MYEMKDVSYDLRNSNILFHLKFKKDLDLDLDN